MKSISTRHDDLDQSRRSPRLCLYFVTSLRAHFAFSIRQLYSSPMHRLLAIFLIFCPLAAAQQNPTTLVPGQSDNHRTCAKNPDQTYALYLPSNYTPTRKWPIIYAFDPSARGDRPVDTLKAGAEKYGYIVAASNNSRNGPWPPEIEAAQAVSDDTHTILSIDDHRVYFTGFSGGARVAGRIAQLCKCAAGVYLNGAGFPSGTSPSTSISPRSLASTKP